MKTHIRNGVVLNPQQRFENAVLTIEDGRIAAITPEPSFSAADGQVIDARGGYVAPGFIDLHFHGALGRDIMDADADSLQAMSAYCARHGVTTFYPTTWCASTDALGAVLDCVRLNSNIISGARIGGVHLEGPYLNTQKRGAQRAEYIHHPDAGEYRSWFADGVVKIVTCAPEVEGCTAFIKYALRHGVRVAIGHSNATYDQVKSAADLGVTQATHIFNGMGGLHHRDPGTAGGVLDDDRLLAQVICDGVHLHPAVVRLILKVKTHSRVALISDSIRGAGLTDGEYAHKEQHLVVKEGVAYNADGRLSGGMLALDQALRNMMAATECGLEQALAMVTSVPADEMGLGGRKGRLAPGYDADLVFLDREFRVSATMIDGEFAYRGEI